MIQTYSLKKDGDVKLSAHFRVREFAEDGNDEVKVDEELITQLEALHTALSCSKIVITSGYRANAGTSQHALGKAADVNCWHMENGKEVRYQGREILLAAEDVGCRGIGWIAGSAASRAAVHLDTRAGLYRFDEADGNRMVKDNSWYAYFGVEKPGAPGGEQDACPYGEPTQLLQKGGTGDGVRWVQWQLSHVQGFEDVEVDGVFGDITAKRVREVQAAAGIKVDGIVGPDTRGTLLAAPSGEQSNPYGEPTALLRKGSTGDGVRWVQWQLSHTHGFEDVKVDGVFGDITDKRVKEVQTAAGIQVDGIVGPDTRKALVSCDETDAPDTCGEQDAPSGAGGAAKTYTVVAGDSLSRIGSKLGVSWRAIAEANGIVDPWIIRPGQVLVIPE